MIRRWLTVIASVVLGGCACSGDPVTETAYAPMASYPTELAACILDQACQPLCRAVFQIGDAEIQRCELLAVDGGAPGAQPANPSTPAALQQVRGASVRVTYVAHAACDDGGSWWGSGDDGSADDGSTDDGSTDDGSADDGSTDDGSTDDGSTDDGSTDDGSTDDGSTDDGSTDDGGDATGDGPAIRHVPGPTAGGGAHISRIAEAGAAPGSRP